MKPFGQVDNSHAMYQCRNKKRKLSAYERRATELALRTTAIVENGGAIPDPHGSQAQKEAWMRQRQAQLGHEREKLRMPDPPNEIQQRWIDEGEK
jgi:hypothetical protein